MAKLTILKESRPVRCEICHQADLFDAATNTCSRCGNLSSLNTIETTTNRNFPAQPAYRPQEVIIPKNVEIEELDNTFMIEYRSGSVKHLLPFMGLSFNIINFFTRPWHTDTTAHILFTCLSFISVAAIIFGFINLLIRKTYLTITADQIIKRDFPNLGFTNKSINIKEIVDFELSSTNGWDKLFLRLNNGKRVKLINNRGDREGMEFIERVLKERLAKKSH